MARPQKEGMDYFPHDVYASSDEKIEPLILLYGAKGYAFYFLHLEYIYRNKELEFDISDAETREVIQQKLHISTDEYEQILQTALKKKCFDKKYYEEFNKLTSNGIKKRAATVYEKREKMRIAYERKISSPVSDAETTHIKKRKVKKSKEYIEEEEEKKQVGEIFQFFSNNIGPITPFQSQVIIQYLDEDGLEPQLIIQILKDSIGKSIPWDWIKTVLQNCVSKGTKTLTRYEAKKAEKERKKDSKGKPQSNKPTFDNFTNREYDGKKLEEAMIKKSRENINPESDIREGESIEEWQKRILAMRKGDAEGDGDY
jgi:DnaD/phage-associated family protein